MPNPIVPPDITLPPPPSPGQPLPTLPPPRRPDIIKGVMPVGEMHTLSGASGAGKTALMAQMISKVQRSEPFFGLETRCPALIAFIAADRRWADHQLWFDAADCKPFLHYSVVDDKAVTGALLRKREQSRDSSAWLFDNIVKVLFGASGPPPDTWLLIDPQSLFIGGDFLKYFPVYTYMLDLSKWALQYDSTIFTSAHAGKQKGDKSQRYLRPQDRIAGTTAQTGCAGTTLHLATPAETEDPARNWSELTWVPHHAPSKTVVLEREPESGLFVPVSTTEAEAILLPFDGARERMLDNARDILPCIPEAPQFTTRQKLIQEAKLSASTYQRYTDALKATGEILYTGYGKWSRPSGKTTPVSPVTQEPLE